MDEAKELASAAFGGLPDIEFAIPADLAKLYAREIRIIIRQPWVIGIPPPEALLNREVWQNISGFDAMLVPKQIYR
jgi:hypothetical protein